MSAVPLLVASDLDGTLLDEADYSYAAARPALAALRERGVPLVLCSSKTRAEMEPLARELGLDTPLVVENGGAVVLPSGALLELGTPRPQLVEALGEIAAETGVAVRGLAAMDVEEVARRTGLGLEDAALALERGYDEPFVLEDAGGLEGLEQAASRRGLRVTRGGRFHHLTGGADKGSALRRVLEAYAEQGRHFTSVGLGDSVNDRPLLEAVDRPILVPRPDGRPDPQLSAALPDAERAPYPGAAGWNAAVLAVLDGARLPSGPPRAGADWSGSLRDAAPYLGLGTSLAASVLLGLGAGYWLDARLGSAPLCFLVGGAFGLAAAGLQLVRLSPRRKP